MCQASLRPVLLGGVYRACRRIAFDGRTRRHLAVRLLVAIDRLPRLAGGRIALDALIARRAVAREVLDKATLALDLARRQRDQAAEQLALLEQGPRPERIAAARAQLGAASAAVATLDATLANSILVAPFAGVVTLRHREPGEIVGAGAAVLTLMNPDDRWVRIYVPENRLGRVAIGQPAAITSDTYPGKRYTGEVAFIASSAEFTPKNVQTTEERVKLVYAVKVRITGDPGEELKPGLPADVTLVEAP